MSIQDVFEPMKALLGEGILYGPQDKEIPNRAPRILWDALGGRELPATRIGGGPGDEGPIATAEWRLSADIWGEDFPQAQQLFMGFRAAAHRFLSRHSFALGTWTWASAVTGRAGSVCVVEFFVNSPLPKWPTSSATIEEMPVAHTIGTVDTFTVPHTQEGGA